MGFRLVPKLVTLNGIMDLILLFLTPNQQRQSTELNNHTLNTHVLYCTFTTGNKPYHDICTNLVKTIKCVIQYRVSKKQDT